MQVKTFGEGQLTEFQVGNNEDLGIVALWNKAKPGDTLHMPPSEALRMAKALTKAATEILKSGVSFDG